MKRSKPKPKAPPDPAKVQICRGYFLQGAAIDDVLEKCRTDWPGVDLDPILAEVFLTFKHAGEQPPALVLGWCLECARDLYREMRSVGDYPGALNALKEIPKIHAKAPKPDDLPEIPPEDIGTLKI